MVSEGLSGEVTFSCVKISGRASKQRDSQHKGPRKTCSCTPESQSGPSGVNKGDGHINVVQEVGRGEITKGFKILIKKKRV